MTDNNDEVSVSSKRMTMPSGLKELRSTKDATRHGRKDPTGYDDAAALASLTRPASLIHTQLWTPSVFRPIHAASSSSVSSLASPMMSQT